MALFGRSARALARVYCGIPSVGSRGTQIRRHPITPITVSIWERNFREMATGNSGPGLGTARDVLDAKGEKYYSTRFDATVLEAVKKMVKYNIGSLIVMDDKGRPVSMITERDYLEKVTVLGRSSRNTLVKDVMSSKEFTFVGPKQSLLETMEYMTSRKIRHVPVVDNEKVLGMISIGDVVKELLEVHRKEAEHMQKYISGGY